MHSVKEIFEDMRVLADILEEYAIDTFKFPEGIEIKKIEEWEQRNNMKLPQGYKDFIVLANGFRYGTTKILPLEKVEMVAIPDGFKGYYMIGSYIGDGSLVLSDEKGDFYYGDHAFGIKKVEFSKFLQDDILAYMKDEFKENDLEIPDNLNTRETEEEKREKEKEIAEMLQKIEKLRKKI